MNLINISGNTFYIRGGTNTGLYLFDDAKRVLVEEINLATNKNKVKYHNSGYLIKSDIQK